MNKKNKIDKHIQVLRCISVFLVIFYHLNLDFFSNGYLGVDIFFLISGYVITMKLYEDYTLRNSINITSFWRRRIQRIYPVLIFSFSATFIFFLFFGQLYLLRGLFEQFVSSIFGISNLYFLFHRVDYFNDLSSSPYLHSWSLGVEEQFYLIYPIILSIFIYLLSIKKVLFVKVSIFILMLMSIYSSFYFETTSPQLSFYFPLLRFWEIGLGCILFFLNFEKLKLSRFNSYLFPIILICLIFFIFSNFEISYTLRNLITIILVAVIIKSYPSKSIFNNFFENKILVYFGNISFSLYLWHLPIIYFLSLYFGHFNITIPALLITIIFSHFSYQLIEQKFRYFKFNNKSFLYISITPAVIFLIISYSIITNENLKNKIKLYVYKTNYLEVFKNYSNRVDFYKISLNGNKIYDFCTDESKDFSLNKFGLIKQCSKIFDNKKLFFFLGNSHTVNFVTAADNFEKVNLYFKHKSNPFDSVNTKYLNQQVDNFKKVIFVSSINNIDQLNKFLNFKKMLSKKVDTLLIGPIPNVENFDPLKCLARNTNCFINITEEYTSRNLNLLNSELIKLEKKNNINVFYPYKYLCRNEKIICDIYDKERDILTHRDGSHLTAEGSLVLLKPLNDFVNENY